jgi:hypothetical protein
LGTTGISECHSSDIDEHVGSHLTEHELAQLGALLRKLADGVGGSALSAFSTSDPS